MSASFSLRMIARLATLVFLGCATLGMSRLADAQSLIVYTTADASSYCNCTVESLAEIYDDSSATELDVFSATYIDYEGVEDYGLSPYVYGRAYQDNTLIGYVSYLNIDGDSAESEDGILPLTNPQEAHTYRIETSSYLADTDETPNACDNGGSTPPCFFITGVYAEISSGPPSIASISPTSVAIGASGQFTVSGENLVDAFNDSNASATGNVSASVAPNPSTDEVKVNYSVPSNVTTGQQKLTISTNYGTSNTETFTVVDPSPTVTGVSPSTWNAGSSQTITVTGTNFGTNPSVSISLPSGIVVQAITTNPSDSSVTASFTVPPDTPSGAATVTVTSTGFNGSGFYPGNSGNSPSASYSTPQVVFMPPTPRINLTNGTTNSPFAGQALSLSVSAPADSGLTVASESWVFINPTDAVAGYIATAASGCYTPVTPSSAPGVCAGPSFNTNQTNLGPFYFIIPGPSESVTVTVTYNLAGGNTSTVSPVATQSFTVFGPTGTLAPTATMLPDNQTVQITNDSDGPNLSLTGSSLPGYSTGTLGIVFEADATLPSSPNSGSLMWVQLIDSDQTFELDSTGSHNCPVVPVSGLDNTYPYASGSKYANDSPHVPVASDGDAEYQRHFHATMYLMWDPAIPSSEQSSCSPAAVGQQSTCSSIPVPLGLVEWGYSGCTINTLAMQDNGTTWSLQCRLGAPLTSQSSGYPTWSQTASNVGPISCGPHTY
jgi:hypothetical protein